MRNEKVYPFVSLFIITLVNSCTKTKDIKYLSKNFKNIFKGFLINTNMWNEIKYSFQSQGSEFD